MSVYTYCILYLSLTCSVYFPQEDFKNCLTYHHHSLQANPSYLSDKPIYSWSETPTLLVSKTQYLSAGVAAEK